MANFLSALHRGLWVVLACLVTACGKSADSTKIWERGFGKRTGPELEFFVDGESLGGGEKGFCQLLIGADGFGQGAVISIGTSEGILSRDSFFYSDVLTASLGDSNLFGEDFVRIAGERGFILRSGHR